jgi:serine/threonine-protein kinase
MSHPNIVSVMDYGVADGAPYIVMEHLEGRTLRELMDEGPVPEAEALRIARALLRGLGYAHGRGLVHRDVKPGNVFLQALDAQGEHVKLLDFGFAKIQAGSELTTGSMISAVDETFGTPAYMSPEQAMGDNLDHRADLYSVGVMLFEMLAGDKPFSGELHDMVKAHLAAPVPPIEEFRPDVRVRPPLHELLAKAMAKNPKDRFPSADDMAHAIEELPRDSLVPKPIWEESVRAAREAEDAEQEEKIAKSEPPPPIEREEDEGRGQTMGFVAVVGLIIVAAVWVMWPETGSESEAVADTEAEAESEPEAEADTEEEAEAEPEAEADTEAEAEPEPEVEAEPEPEPEADLVFGLSDSESEAVLDYEDPWHLHPTVPLLEEIRASLDAGETPPPRTVRQLRAYSRGNRADPRPHLLLARIFYERHWWSDALARFTLAYEVDHRIADDPVMRELLRRLAENPHSAGDATQVMTQIYGPRPN